MTKTINVCLLGDIESNKSDLIRIFTNSIYDWYNEDTTEIIKSYKYIYYKRPYNFILSDTDISNKYYIDTIQQCDAFILTFSLTTKKTGENLEYYYNLINENKKRNVPIILVGISNEFGRFEFNIADIQKMKQKLGVPYTTAFQNDSNSIVSTFHLLIETIEEFENKQLKILSNNSIINTSASSSSSTSSVSSSKTNNIYNSNNYNLNHINNNNNPIITSTTTTTTTTTINNNISSINCNNKYGFLKRLKIKLIK